MSEPRTRARKLQRIVPGLYRYTVLDDRIDAESDAFALVEKERAILIDPLPLQEEALRQLPPVESIVLSASCHQRSAWRYRKRFGARVYAPVGARNLEEKPDVAYDDGRRLPGGLRAIHAPGPTGAHYAFLLDRGGGVVLCGDLVKNLPREGLAFIPGEYQDDPRQTRVSVRKLLRRKFRILCTSHGSPIRAGARKALTDLLRKDRET